MNVTNPENKLKSENPFNAVVIPAVHVPKPSGLDKSFDRKQKENPVTKLSTTSTHDEYPEQIWSDREEYELIDNQIKEEASEQSWENIEEAGEEKYQLTKIDKIPDTIANPEFDETAQLICVKKPYQYVNSISKAVLNKESSPQLEKICQNSEAIEPSQFDETAKLVWAKKSHQDVHDDSRLEVNLVRASLSHRNSPAQLKNNIRDNPIDRKSEFSNKFEEVQVNEVRKEQANAEDFQTLVTNEEMWNLQDSSESLKRTDQLDDLRSWGGHGSLNVFVSEDTWSWRPALRYFLKLWLPRLVDLLDMIMDFLVMCIIQSSGAQTMQGCFLFLPFVVLWGSRYNTSQFEAWYLDSLSKDNGDPPNSVLLNTLPWTGVPTVFLQECFFLLYMVFIFPLKFWIHQFKESGRPFQLSTSIYEESKVWYTQMLRLWFEDLPTIVLLFWLLCWNNHNISVVVFSLLMSILSSFRTLARIQDISRSRGEPICMVIFSTLLIPPHLTVIPHQELLPSRERLESL